MPKVKERLYRCPSCDDIHTESATLKGASPFDPQEFVLGCPRCKAINSDEQLCDEEGCDREATCGTPSTEGYRRVCGGHYALPVYAPTVAKGDE